MTEHPSRQHDHHRLRRRMVRLSGIYKTERLPDPWGEKNVPQGTEGWITDVYVPPEVADPVQYLVMWRGHSTPGYVDCMSVELLAEVPDLSDMDALEEWLRAS